eukprot:1290185-Alexandrium_andersonii.AAC.1
MRGGVPEGRPGLEGGGARAKRSRSAGASPSTSSPPVSTTPTAAPTAFGPTGVAGMNRRSPESQTQQASSGRPGVGSSGRARLRGGG